MSAGRVNGKALQRKIMNIGTETEREGGEVITVRIILETAAVEQVSELITWEFHVQLLIQLEPAMAWDLCSRHEA
jgi:hypothetical protein